jgi:large conductance mechanosensitive channel
MALSIKFFAAVLQKIRGDPMGEFKKFIMKGNVLDLAVAVIIAGAFGRIVTSLVNDILMPLIGVIMGGVEFTSLKYVVEEAQGDIPELAVYYGQFIQSVVDFLIIAFVIFIMIRLITRLKSKPAPEEQVVIEPPADTLLLTEIRDLLKNPLS